MSDNTLFIYLMVIIVFIFYLSQKMIVKNYILSCFNISFYIYIFSFLIIPVFYYVEKSWYALGIADISIVLDYLDKSVLINGVGIIIILFTMFFFENSTKKNIALKKFSKKMTNNYTGYIFYIIIFLWYILVLAYNKALPMFSSRTFYVNSPISSIYLGLNEIIMIFSLYYGSMIVYKKKGYFNWLVAIMTLFFVGSRGPVLVNCIAPVVLLYIFNRTSKSLFKRVSFSAIALLSILFLGIILNFFRSSSNISISEVFMDILYGNSFSDIRDGAYILKGYEAKYGDKYLYGNNYFAALLSFVPTSKSPYRFEWNWGNFTAGLFGYENHLGLRGGYSIEPFLNFGWTGVIIFAFLEGLVLGFLEKSFYKQFIITNNVGNICYTFTLLFIIAGIASNVFICTSGFYNIYVDILVVVLFIFLHSFSKRKKYIIGTCMLNERETIKYESTYY